MKVVEKKYLGDITARVGSNASNIKERTNKGHGSVIKIVTTLNERHYGKHQFKAAMLMRGGMLVGGMLTNSECWINITKKDVEKLEVPDIILQKKILSAKGNPSKCFMQLELGIIPIKFVLKLRRLNFLHYILNEDTDSMISQVYHTMKEDSKKGDYIGLINKDKLELGINLTDSEIKDLPRSSWKRYIKETVTSASLLYLVEENSSKNKTKHIVFNELKLNEYLKKMRKFLLQ